METDKKHIRSLIQNKRNLLSDKEISGMSLKIADYIINMKEFKEADNILTYVSFRSEVKTDYIIENAFELGKKVFVPKVIGKNMIFVKIESFKELTQGYMGIREPVSSDEADIKEGFMCMPGMVFDNECNRIGYGGGFYDRYLSKDNEFIKAALCYDFQILEEIPHEPHDLKPDYVISEKRVIRRTDIWYHLQILE